MVCRKETSLFSHHSQVFDFRDISGNKPNNNIVITCEHATNNLHYLESKASKEDKSFLETHWGYDPGAKDIAIDLAEKSKTLLVYPNFGRLILDPNRSIISTTLIRKFVEKDIELHMNKEENQNRNERIDNFYVPYYR